MSDTIDKILKTNTNVFLNHQRSTLINDDVTKSDLFEKDIFDIIITSPPYNVKIDYSSHNDNMDYKEYLEFSEVWLSNCYKWVKKQGRLCLNIPLSTNIKRTFFGADLYFIGKKVGWKYRAIIIWNKNNTSKRTAWGSWKSATAPDVIPPAEIIIVFYKDEWKKTTGSQISDITQEQFIEWTLGLWTFSGEHRKKSLGHPAPFPYDLPFRCIKLFSFVDDVIFDPFAGSGTTLIVANNTNRYSVGVEKDKNYCEIAKKRILNESLTLPF